MSMLQIGPHCPENTWDSFSATRLECTTSLTVLRGWFIGSGVIEAGCKTVVGARLKQSGMFWSEPSATSVLNFRTLLLSHRFDDFWTHRANTLASTNDTLAFPT